MAGADVQDVPREDVKRLLGAPIEVTLCGGVAFKIRQLKGKAALEWVKAQTEMQTEYLRMQNRNVESTEDMADLFEKFMVEMPEKMIGFLFDYIGDSLEDQRAGHDTFKGRCMEESYVPELVAAFREVRCVANPFVELMAEMFR